MEDFIKINEKDNVAVSVTGAQGISKGHKIALKEIKAGEDIVKYGCPIGHALRDIHEGEWVHSHNVATNLSDKIEYAYEKETKEKESIPPLTFQGYRRADGKVGIRNEIWIIPTVGCVNDVAKALAKENQDLVEGSIDGLYTFPHPFGCSQTGKDHEQTKRLLASLAKHPNAGAVLVLGLGCENLTHDQFVEALGEFDADRIKFLTCQQVSDEMEEGRKQLISCANFAKRFQREEIPVSELVIGMKCGGSDGFSGISANPVVGQFSDMLTAMGGTTILTEVPEMFGGESFLLNRCKSKEVFEKAADMLNGFKDYFIEHHEVVYENPSPGNKEGGITTLEEKSCGCVQKGGSAEVQDVIGYGERVKEKGLNLLNGPGNDLVSATALTAAGAQLILFTTGRGTPFGAPAPTMKIATNTELANRKANWIDFNAGVVVDGTYSIHEAAEYLLLKVLGICSGNQTKSEQNGYREIAIFKDGVTL